MRNPMVIVLAIIVLSTPGTIVLPAAADPAPQSNAAKPAPSMNDAGVLQGQLLKIDGDFYVVKDASGKEVRLRVSKNTVLDTRIKVGDRVDAQIAADGSAATLLKALQ